MERKTQGTPWALQVPLACPRTQMQSVTRMAKQVIIWGLLAYDNNELKCELDEINTFIIKFSSSGGAFPLKICIHVRLGPIYWGDYLPCRKDYKVMVFYM